MRCHQTHVLLAENQSHPPQTNVRVAANHGGGYQYRLAKKPAGGNHELTEAMFQQMPLEFTGSQSWLQYGGNSSLRFPIEATRTAVGTTPKGSQWTKNPIVSPPTLPHPPVLLSCPPLLTKLRWQPACGDFGGGSGSDPRGVPCAGQPIGNYTGPAYQFPPPMIPVNATFSVPVGGFYAPTQFT